MQSRHQSNEFRVSVLFPSGNRTSKKCDHLAAAIRFINRTIEKSPGAKIKLQVRKVEPWEAMPYELVPEAHRWV